ncbi:hypothetical protein TIFTF001_008413 [Ficus carica]|uniref:Glycosyltransferase n=1 Tax=Ficus carica TaxID=3494 RepID=A0AA87ZLB7_FICCA|nr:hypothetical protein TIFTF001_008413 [Ficus carica]
MEDHSSCPKPVHAIVMPVPLQGHVIPAVHLALKLASNGFTITFINTEIIHHQLTTTTSSLIGGEKDIFSGAREESGLDIRHRTVNDGFPLSFDRMANHDQYVEEGHVRAMPALMDGLVGEIVKEADPPVSCLITDGFFGSWPSILAEKYNLVYVSFWTEPALVFTLYYHLDLLKTNGHYASRGNRAKGLTILSSRNQCLHRHAPTHRHGIQGCKKADFILCNTIHELELDPIMALQEKQPFYSIGPLFPYGLTKTIVPTSLRVESNCTQWLNTKPHGSVMYVSFGSLITCRKSEIGEIALGLALSKVNFIWVLRIDAVSYDEPYILPIGFEEEVKDRGLVVTWTNQIDVISHQSIGGFLTHCGWNSVLESIWFGVPMLCFPLATDQTTNRKLVVDDWKIGLNLCDRKPLTRLEVSEKIDRLMSGKSGDDELRTEVTKVRKTLESALASNGSSQRNLCKFIANLKAKIK